MSSILPPLDLETVLVSELEQDEPFAALVGGVGDPARISTRLPSTFTKEDRLKLERSGGSAVGWPDYLDRAIVTFHAYGASDSSSWAVAAELVAALARLEGKTVAGGVVTAVDRVLGPLWSPDPDAADAPRYLLQVAFTAHPVRPPAP